MRRWPDRPSSSAARGYGYRWQKARLRYLSEHPLCVMCMQAGRVTAATVVDHRIPHRGDPVLFWDETNWQALCKTHHDSAAQKRDNQDREVGCGPDGLPLDDGHPWRA